MKHKLVHSDSAIPRMNFYAMRIQSWRNKTKIVIERHKTPNPRHAG